jgi:hypothetical protein
MRQLFKPIKWWVMKTVFILAAGFLLPFIVSGQQPYESFHLTVNGSGAFPIGSFQTAVAPNGGGFGIGGGATALFNLKGKYEYFPLFLGADFNYLSFGRDKQPSTEVMPPLKTAFNYYGISAIGRAFLSAKKSGFVPFIDGQVGLNIINTRTKVDKNLGDILMDEDYPEVLNTTNDLGLMYGASLGFYIRKPLDENNRRLASFFMKGGYMAGDNIEHVKRGTLKVNNGNVTYQTTTTSVNNIIFQLGFVLPIL